MLTPDEEQRTAGYGLWVQSDLDQLEVDDYYLWRNPQHHYEMGADNPYGEDSCCNFSHLFDCDCSLGNSHGGSIPSTE